jgi:hypothetical protein
MEMPPIYYSETRDLYCTECGRVCEHTVVDIEPPPADGLEFIRTTCDVCSCRVTWAG